jgi:hypothetical protein
LNLAIAQLLQGKEMTELEEEQRTQGRPSELELIAKERESIRQRLEELEHLEKEIEYQQHLTQASPPVIVQKTEQPSDDLSPIEQSMLASLSIEPTVVSSSQFLLEMEPIQTPQDNYKASLEEIAKSFAETVDDHLYHPVPIGQSVDESISDSHSLQSWDVLSQSASLKREV